LNFGNNSNTRYAPQIDEAGIAVHMAKVMMWMVCGLVLTFAVAWYSSQNEAVMDLVLGNPVALIVVIVAQLALVFSLSAAIQKLSFATALIMFTLYSVLNGVTMSFIMLVYELDSIMYVFLLTALIFIGMSVYGFTTKKDLTRIGSLCIFGLFGIILAGVLNIFFRSDTLGFGICVIGIGIFIVLTAWDTQRIKHFYIDAIEAGYHPEDEFVKKQALMGALRLYLDFINIFLKLLRLMGRRR